MAKYERKFRGNFYEMLERLNEDIKRSSSSASYEDGSDFISGSTKAAVRVYERYSMAGGNRDSLNVTLIDNGKELFLSAITSGGSQAVFFKINTWGEETFLQICRESVEEYISGYRG